MSKIEKQLILIIVIIVVAFGIIYYFALKSLSEVKTNLQNQQQIYNQNQLAAADLLKQKADSIQVLHAQVTNLNSENNHLKKTINIYAQNTQILIDSVNSQGKALTALSSDSSGKYAEVSFNGTQGIFKYSGWTKYYFPPSIIGSLYGITLGASPIIYKDVLYYDFADKTLKSRSFTTTPGVELLVNTQIDSSVYRGLVTTVTTNQKESSNIFPSFGLQLKANLGIGTTNINVSGNQFNGVFFDGSAMAYYKWANITWYPLSKAVSIGVIYNLDLGKELNKLF